VLSCLRIFFLHSRPRLCVVAEGDVIGCSALIGEEVREGREEKAQTNWRGRAQKSDLLGFGSEEGAAALGGVERDRLLLCSESSCFRVSPTAHGRAREKT